VYFLDGFSFGLCWLKNIFILSNERNQVSFHFSVLPRRKIARSSNKETFLDKTPKTTVINRRKKRRRSGVSTASLKQVSPAALLFFTEMVKAPTILFSFF
jgi:hypothetical protein